MTQTDGSAAYLKGLAGLARDITGFKMLAAYGDGDQALLMYDLTTRSYGNLTCAKLLAAAPNLAKAAQSYRRNVATLRRAALPRRSPGPWRADREVLEEASRAVEFVQKLYDAYAEAWADQPLPKDLGDQTAAELDRFLAWTQLDRYVELAVLASTNAPRPSKPGQHVISAPKEATSHPPPVSEASPGAVVADSDPGPAGEPEEEPSAPTQPIAEPEPGRA